MLFDALIIPIGDVSGVNVCVMTLCVCVWVRLLVISCPIEKMEGD